MRFGVGLDGSIGGVGWLSFRGLSFMEDWDILLVLEVLDDRVLVYRYFQCLSSASRDGYPVVHSCGAGVVDRFAGD